MGNRMMKETIRTSKTVNSMTDFQFRTWVYLITYVDDYGRGSADPELLKGFVFPRRKGVSEQTIAKTLAELATIGSIDLYEVDGESYLCFPNWSEHQRIQQKRSKFPEPPKVTVSHGEIPSETKPKPNLETETEEEGEPFSCAEPVEDGSPPVITLTLNDKSEYPISEEQAEEWAGLYPAVDVIQQLRSMKGWLDANPTKRKTKAGIKRFINGWLSKEQNKGGSVPSQGGGQRSGRRDPMDELRDLHDAFSAEEGYR